MTDDEYDAEATRRLTAPRTPAPTAPATPPPAGATETMPTTKPDAPAPAVGVGSSFGGDKYGTTSGYLQAFARSIQPEVQAQKSEQEAKNLVQSRLQALLPELKARGVNVGDIKNEKIQIDGKWVDLFRDIGGASEAQYLVDEGGGAGSGAMGAARALGMAAPAAGTSYGGVQSLMPTDDAATAEMMARLKEILGGDAAFDRQALLAQMQR